MKNQSFFYFMLAASLIAFLVSIYFWFLTEGNQMEAIFVGIWVPSILSFAALLQVSKK
jgi:hypothetical protein|tara:strand:- start:90 stop:263 length:174 start_codon:yes stop_codon:yes gene_type:complete